MAALEPLPALRCPACGSPMDEGTSFCTTCGTPMTGLAAPGSAADTQPLTAGFTCRSCGATAACEPGPRSYECAFCGSSDVAEVRGGGLSGQVPGFIVPFRVGREQARGTFDDWCRADFYTPRGMRQTGRLRLQGIYLPFWTFSMRADSTWEADIGEWWYEETTPADADAQGKTQTRKTQVRHTEWHPLRGRHHRDHGPLLVSGAHGLPQAEVLSVGPFHLPEMRRCRPQDLAGWLAEPFSVPREQALAECQQAFREAEGKRIHSFLPGDTQSGVEWTTTFSEVSEDLVLLPFWIGTYSYRGKVYRYVVSGQTGKVAGPRPVSPVKVGLVIAGVLLEILLIVLLVLLSLGLL